MRKKFPWFASLSKLVPGVLRNAQARRIAACLLVVLTFSCCANGQTVVPGLRFASRISVFGTFTDIKPNYGYVSDLAVYGFTLGGYLQTPHVFGLEVRGSVARWGGGEHEEAALAGPRLALHRGRYSPYFSALGGGGNVWTGGPDVKEGYSNASKVQYLGPQWTILGGVDIHLHHRWSIRAAEVSYSKVYVPTRTITPIGASAGIVYRLR